MSEIDEAIKYIREAREGLEPLRSYPDAVSSIEDLNAIEELLKNPTLENLNTALEKFEVLMKRAEPYEPFIPDIVEKAKKARELVIKAKEKL